MVDSFSPLFTWETGAGEFGVVMLAGERDGKPYTDAYVSRYVSGRRSAFAVVDLSSGSLYESFDQWRYAATGWRPEGNWPAIEKLPVLGCGHRHMPDKPTDGVVVLPAVDDDGVSLCRPCSDDRTRAHMAACEPGQRVYAYLAAADKSSVVRVVTFTGGLLGFARRFGTSTGVTPTGGEYTAHYYQVRDLSGALWSARGLGPGMALSLLRLKNTAAA